MTFETDETHSAALTSWVESAHANDTDFPIQNLPYGVFREKGIDESFRVGIAIGGRILDIPACLRADFFQGDAVRAAEACRAGSLNELMALGPRFWSALRRRVSRLLNADCDDLRRHPDRDRMLIPADQADLRLPVQIGDFTDFYASISHATNVGGMFRPAQPLMPNYKYLPVAYHARSSSIVLSGTGLRRPWGQILLGETAAPSFAPTRQLDYELEVGCYVGPGNRLGESIPIQSAENHLFGLCLLNDWSARDIQKWEYQPLGPFLAKSFATTVSPWVVTLEALAPFRIPAFERSSSDPPLPDHLYSQEDRMRGGFDLTLEVYLSTLKMRETGLSPIRLSMGGFGSMYWTLAQMVAHHTSNGCNLRSGDLLASGTVSGPARESRGCLLELTWRGEEPLPLPSGETRRFLEDEDEVILRGNCRREGYARIGFGECRGKISPAQRAEQ